MRESSYTHSLSAIGNSKQTLKTVFHQLLQNNRKTYQKTLQYWKSFFWFKNLFGTENIIKEAKNLVLEKEIHSVQIVIFYFYKDQKAFHKYFIYIVYVMYFQENTLLFCQIIYLINQ